MVDPFGSMPFEIDDITNQLLHFYGHPSYWQTAYALSPKVKLSMKGSWEYQAGGSPTHFHTLMARSALHQLRMNKWTTLTTRKTLQFAALKHQSEAVSALRRNVDRGSEADLKEIMTSTISLGTFEQRYGSREIAQLHFKVARDVFKQLGFGDGLHGRLREEQALWFEGIYADPHASFMWGMQDVPLRTGWAKALLEDVDRVWRLRQTSTTGTVSFIHRQRRFAEFLSRDTNDRLIGAYGDIDETTSQQRCLLILVIMITSIEKNIPQGGSGTSPSSRLESLYVAASGYASWIEAMLVENDLGEEQAIADLLWIMLQNYRDVKPQLSNQVALQALRSLDAQECQWKACGVANIMKYLPGDRRAEVSNWLLGFVKGKLYPGKVVLDDFMFSYKGNRAQRNRI